MNVEINGEQLTIAENTPLSEALEKAGIDTKGIAIAVNQKVIKKESYPTHILNEGDKVLIIKVFYGG